MTKENAISSAQQHANRTKETHVAVRARNGQWMRERLAFVESDAGRDLYPTGRERVVCSPQVLQ